MRFAAALLPLTTAAGFALLPATLPAQPSPCQADPPRVNPPSAYVDLPVIQGLATQATLAATPSGRNALRANLRVTGAIQNGTLRIPSALTFPEQQQLALRDAAITGANLAQLADGLGSTLAAAYTAAAHDDAQGNPQNVTPSVQRVIRYSQAVTRTDSDAGKYLFGNLTTNGKDPAPASLQAIVTAARGHVDAFGTAYARPMGSHGADPYGDSRPFQTLRRFTSITGRDYRNRPSSSTAWLRGPDMDLVCSPSYPSGHTTYGYTGSLLLGLLVPDRYPQMIVRGAEYGTSRILLGAHYTMDVLGGRALALYDLAHLLSNDPAWMNRSYSGVPPVQNFRDDLATARRDLARALADRCGDTVSACATMDIGRFNDPASNALAYNATQTYSLPVVFSATAHATEDVSTIAPEAGYLLTVPYPSLTLEEADNLLTQTEGPGGSFLDNGSALGLYSRLNLYQAALRARAIQQQRQPAP